jgi:hypothetical protein
MSGTAQGFAVGSNAPSAEGVVGVVTDNATKAAVGEEMSNPVGWAKILFDGAVAVGSFGYCYSHL